MWYDGIGDFFNWIENLGESVTGINTPSNGNEIIWGADWFNNVGAAVGSAVSSALYFIFKEPIGLLAAIFHLLGVLVELVGYIFAPFWFIAKFIAGAFAGLGLGEAVAASNTAYNNATVINFILAFPGYSELILVVNAILWVMLGFHILRELKNI